MKTQVSSLIQVTSVENLSETPGHDNTKGFALIPTEGHSWLKAG